MAPTPQQGIGIFTPPEELEGTTPPAGAPPAPGTPARGIGIFTPSLDDPLTKALKTNTLSPAEAAEVLDLQRQTGLMAETITRHKAAIQADLAAYGFDAAAFRAKSPKLAEWLSEQHTRVAAYAQDVERLNHLEQTVGLGAALVRSVDNLKALVGTVLETTGELLGASATAEGRWEGGFQVLGLLDPEPLRYYGERMRIENRAKAEAWGRRTTFAEARQGEFGQWLMETGADVLPQVGLALAGGWVGQAGAVAIGARATVGAALGALVPAYVQSTGALGEAIKEAKPGTEAPGWVFLGGAPLAALDAVTEMGLATKLVQTFGRETAEQMAVRLLQTPVKPGWWKVGVGGSIVGITGEGLTEAAQGAVETVLAAGATGTPLPSAPEFAARAVEEFAAGLVGGTTMTVPATAITLPRQRAQWEAAYTVAQQQAQVFDQLATGVLDAKTLTQHPDSGQELLQALVKDGPLETMSIPIEPWIAYWTEQGADPHVMAEQLTGSRTSVQEALEAGKTDLVVPTAAYGMKIAPTEHHAAFAKELRLRPDFKNMREVEAEMAASVEAAENAAAETTAEATPEQQAQWAQARTEVYDLFLKRSLDAGATRVVADAWAKVQAAAFVQRAVRTNIDPATLLGLRGPAALVTDAMAPEARAAAQAQAGTERFPDIPPSRATAKEAPEQRATRRTAQLTALTQALTRFARRIDPTVSEATISEELTFRIEMEEERQQAARLSGRGQDLLRAIADKGGISTTAVEGEFREFAEEWSDARRKGSRREWNAVRDVFTPGGETPDDMATLLRQDERFTDLDGPNELADAITDALRAEPDVDMVPGTAELAALGIDPYQRWWGDAWREAATEEVEGGPEEDVGLEADAVDTGEGDVSFDPDSPFFQLSPETTPKGYAVIAPHLTDAEKVTLRRDTAQRMMDIFKALPPDADFAAAALAGGVKKGWYERSRLAIEAVFGPVDSVRFTALLAALSPQTSVETNLANTLRVWAAWVKAGRPTDTRSIKRILDRSLPKAARKPGEGKAAGVLPSWVPNSVRALKAADPRTIVLSGPKVQSFAMNLWGHLQEVTNDAWMANFALVDQAIFGGSLQTAGTDPGKGPGYRAMNAKVRRVAKLLTQQTGELWTPAHVQETVWSWAKTLYELAEARGTTAEALVQSGELTDAAIAGTPDFAGLFTQDATVRSLLEAGGYGQVLTALGETFGHAARAGDGRAGPAGTGTGGADRPVTPALLRSARRLDRLARQRAAEKRATVAATRAAVTVAQKAAAARAAARTARARQRQQAFTQEAQDTTWRAPLFYSRLTRAVEASTLQRGSGAQWKATIRNAKTGINEDEWLFAHVADLEDDKTYARAQVLEYLAANTIDLRIIELTDAPDVNDPRIQARADEIYQRELQRGMVEFAAVSPPDPYEARADYNEETGLWDAFVGVSGVQGRLVGSWATEAEALADGQQTSAAREREYQAAARDYAAQRADYDEALREAQNERSDTLPLAKYAGDPSLNLGGPTVARSYREVFVTAPLAGKRADTAAFERALRPLLEHDSPTVQEIARELQRVPGTADARLAFLEAEIEDWRATAAGVPMEFPLETAGLVGSEVADLLETVREQIAVIADDTTWNDGHTSYSAIENPIVRIRYDVRVLGDGRQMLFIQELQPPQQQEFAKMPRLLQAQWRELGMKWALAQAAELGLDVVGWTPGHVQADRYNLRKVVDVLEYYPATRQLNGFKDGNRQVVRTVPPEQLADYVGAEVATRLLAPDATLTDEAISRQVLAGKQLEVGGAGLARLYDEDFVRVANKLGKRYGAKTETVAVDVGETASVYTGPDVTAATLRADYDAISDAKGVLVANQARAIAHAMGAGQTFTHAMEREGSIALAEYYGGTMTRREAALDSPAIAITPPMHTAITGQGQALFQEEGAPPAAGRPDALGMYDPSRNLITLFAGKMDLSTALHEFAHQFLEDMLFDVGLIPPPGARTRLQQQLADDLDLALREIGFTGTVDEWRGLSNNARRSHHEMFARAFEKYLATGRAPSAELGTLFQKFKQWFLRVYQNLRRLNVEVSSELAGVFDRLLASEEAIAAAKAETQMTTLFTDQAQAGVDTQTWLAHQALVAEASRKAQEDVDRRLMQDVRREQQADWQAERERMRATVATEFNSRPAFVALSMIRTGRLPDGSINPRHESGEPLKLSRADLVGQFGREILATLPRPYLYSVEGGIPVATAAELFGFPSADALIEALQVTPSTQRAIDEETDARMRREHADTLLEGIEIEELAENALHTHRAAVISAELEALTQGMAGARMSTAAQRRAAAEARVAQTHVRDLKPGLYLAAAQRASQRAFTAFSRNDRAAAIAAKEDELTALAMHRAARDAQATLATQQTQLQKYAAHTPTRQRIGKAGPEYLEQMDAVLEQFEFKQVTQKAVRRREALRDWVKRLVEQNLPVNLPESVLADARRINYQELTVEEVTGIYEAVTQIAHLATLKNKLLKAADKRDFTEVAAELALSIRVNKGGKGPAITALGLETRLPKKQAAQNWEGWKLAHRKIASLAREFDGLQDGGAFWNAIIRPLNEAGDREASLNAEASTALYTLFERYTPAERQTWYEQRHYPFLGRVTDPNAQLSTQARLMVALNVGNAVNRQRMRDGHGWTEAQLQQILDTLDAKDWAFVQGMWDFVGHYWPDIAAKQQRVTGLEPTRVEAQPVQTKYGTFAGGYFPLSYDRKLAASPGAADDIAMMVSYVATTTARGHVEARSEGELQGLKVRLDFGVVFEHVGKVIHDLSHHEALVDVNRLLRHKGVSDAIYEAMGPEAYALLTDTIRDIAVGDVRARNKVEQFANHIRVGGTVVGMGWGLMTALQQPFGIAQSMARLGSAAVGRGLLQFLGGYGHMKRTVEDVQARSEFMRNRGRTMQREINEVRNTLGDPGRLPGWIDEALRTVSADRVTKAAIADSYFSLIHGMQTLVDVPTWLAAEAKALADPANTKDDGTIDLARVIALADQAVLDTQGGGQIKDLAAIQRGPVWLKLFTSYYSFFSTTFQLWQEAQRGFERAPNRWTNPAAMGELAVQYLLVLILPAMLSQAFRDLLKGEEPEDILEHALVAPVAYFMGTMMFTRELAGAFQGYLGYEGPAGMRSIGDLTKVIKPVMQGKWGWPTVKAAAAVTGALMHWPTGQVMRTLEGFMAMLEGQTANPGALIVGPPREAR